MHILISADKFKDCLSAEAACETIADAIRSQHPDAVLQLCPLSDGGEGFAQILTSAANGLLPGEEVCDPLGRTTQASFGIVELQDICHEARARLHLPHGLHEGSRIAIVEMAAASGLQLLQEQERDPWQTHTFGTGQLLHAAQSAGAELILLGVGGSATNDLGLGALSALGYRFTDVQGQPVEPPCPANWHRITRIEGRLPDGFPPLRIACDVTNPLLGAKGATAIFAPQKGLLKEDFSHLEAQAARMAALLCEHHRCPLSLANQSGAGAAGGIAFGLLCAANGQALSEGTQAAPDSQQNAPHQSSDVPHKLPDAQHHSYDATQNAQALLQSASANSARAMLISGFELVAEWLQLHRHIAQADIVITGEGRFDASSLKGKGPGALATAALQQGKVVHIFAGHAECPPQPGLHLHSITPENMPIAEALRNAPSLLHAAAARAFANRG